MNQIPKTGRPQRASILGNKLYFDPVPDSAYTVEVEYYEAPLAMSSDNDTSSCPVEFNELIVLATKIMVAKQLNKMELVPILQNAYELEKANALAHWKRRQGIEESTVEESKK